MYSTTLLNSPTFNFVCDLGTTVHIEECEKLPVNTEYRVLGSTKWFHTVHSGKEEGHRDFCCR